MFFFNVAGGGLDGSKLFLVQYYLILYTSRGVYKYSLQASPVTRKITTQKEPSSNMDKHHLEPQQKKLQISHKPQ